MKNDKELVDCDSKRLLIVDDEKPIRKMFVQTLSSSFPDLVIETAGDGIQALELFKESHHGLIIMDVVMPGMNGEEAFTGIEAVCKRNAWKFPSFIFCTGFAVGDTLRRIVGDESFHSCLEKPITMDNLVETVRKHQAR